jgi:DNA-binding Lrp family transcriptional regulator
MTSERPADAVDARLLLALAKDPRASIIALADAIGVSRNTVQAHMNRWAQRQVLLAFDRRIDPAFIGYPMQAFILTRLKQRLLAEVSAALADIPEVVEVHGLSGGDDLLVQVVARDADDLYRIAGQILDIRGVQRTSTSLVMRKLMHYRLSQLIHRDSGRY